MSLVTRVGLGGAKWTKNFERYFCDQNRESDL